MSYYNHSTVVEAGAYHSISSKKDNQAGNDIPLRLPILSTGQPDTNHSAGPPNDTHGGMLNIIMGPFLSPAVLGKGIDATPGRNNRAVPKLLALIRPPQEALADKQHETHDHAVSYKGAPHDEVGQTLAEMVSVTESERRNTAKAHLHPRGNRHGFSDEAVRKNKIFPDTPVETTFQVKLEIDSEYDLNAEEKHHKGGELGVDIWGELTAFVGMSKGPIVIADHQQLKALSPRIPLARHLPSHKGEYSSDYLDRNMPSRTYYPEDHADGKDDAERRRHGEYVPP